MGCYARSYYLPVGLDYNDLVRHACVVNVCGFMAQYLLKRRQCWLVCLEIPKALRPQFGGKRRHMKSLQTDSLSEAERRKLPYIAKWKAEFEALRTRTNGPLLDLQTALEWREDLKQATDDQRSTLLGVLADTVEDLSWGDPKAGEMFGQVVTGVTLPTTEHLEAWLASRDVEKKTKDMSRTDVQRLAKRFPYSHLIDHRGVRRWTQSLREEEDLSLTTIRRITSSCRGYWRYLQLKDAVSYEQQPFHEVIDRQKPSKADIDRKRRHFPPSAVPTLVEAALEKGDAKLADLIWIAMWTGCRIEEICALKVSDVETCHFEVTDAKTEAGRRQVPIHSHLESCFKRLCASSADGYVLSGLTQNKYGDRSNAIGKRFGHLKNKLGHPSQYVFHSLRRTVVTMLENAGIEEAVAADIVGHDKKTLTYGHYSGGSSLVQKADAIEKLRYNLPLRVRSQFEPLPA